MGSMGYGDEETVPSSDVVSMPSSEEAPQYPRDRLMVTVGGESEEANSHCLDGLRSTGLCMSRQFHRTATSIRLPVLPLIRLGRRSKAEYVNIEL